MVTFPDWLTKRTAVLPPVFGIGILAWGLFFGWNTVSTLVIPAIILLTLNPVVLLLKRAGLSQTFADALWAGNYLLPGAYFVWVGLAGGPWVILLSGVMTIGFGLSFLWPVIDKGNGYLIGYGAGIVGFPVLGIYMVFIREWIVGLFALILAPLFVWRGRKKFQESSNQG